MLRLIRHRIGLIYRSTLIWKYRLLGVQIGKDCFLSSGAWIDTRRGTVRIGDNVTITNGVKILSHDASAYMLGKNVTEAITTIEDRVFVGMNAIILPGVTVHENSIIGAGSVVTKDVEPYVVAAGNPCKTIRQIPPK